MKRDQQLAERQPQTVQRKARPRQRELHPNGTAVASLQVHCTLSSVGRYDPNEHARKKKEAMERAAAIKAARKAVAQPDGK